MADAKYGKTTKGEVIHYSKMLDGLVVARCDGRRLLKPIEASPEEITCSKCQRYADHKRAILARAQAGKADPESKPEADNHNQRPPEREPEEAPEGSPKQDLDPFIADLIIKKLDELSGKIKNVIKRVDELDSTGTKEVSKKKLSEENYKEFLKEGTKSNEVGPVEGKQFSYSYYVTDGDEFGRIIHIPTKTTVFNRVAAKVVPTAIKFLNNMKIRWENKFETPPKDFVSACAAAFKAANKCHGIDLDMKVDPNTPAPRILKRRTPTPQKEETSQKEERVLKRRGENNRYGLNRFGYRKKSIHALISEMMSEGVYYGELCSAVEKQFNCSRRDTTAKLKAVIRKLVKDGFPVMIIRQKSSENDFYDIIENQESTE